MTEKHVTSEEHWAAEELADVDLKDTRLNRRCQEIAIALGEQPTAPINQACEDWADTKAAYRFFDNEKSQPEAILAPHYRRTVERMKENGLVLAVQDTTFFNYTHHPQTIGLGAIGNKNQKQRGFGMHTTQAVTADGLPLGLLTQTFIMRPIGETSHKVGELHKLPIEEKESYRWLESFGQVIALAPEEVEVVTVCDSEADIYEMFVLASEKDAKLLVRSSGERCLAETEIKHLWRKAERQAIVGHLKVNITPNQKRAAREANVSVQFTQVTLKAPWRPEQKVLPTVILQAILVREVDPPDDLEDPIEWLLLTNTAVNDFDDCQRVIAWYCCRWQIEVFHKIIKSGCTVEDCRLETADRLKSFIALMCIVAWRLHWLTYLNRSDPNAPCTAALTTIEWQALYIRIHKTTSLPSKTPSLHEATRWIAQLGGFLGRKSDGEPGITAIWRGWQRLQDIASTWYLVNVQTQLVGNR